MKIYLFVITLATLGVGAVSFETDGAEIPDEPNAVLDRDEEEGSTSSPLVLSDSDDFSLGEEEMEELSRQPLFKEFASIIDETAPLPESVNLEDLNVPGASLVAPRETQGDIAPSRQKTSTALDPELEKLLQETLAIADVDLERYALDPKQKRALQSLDAEISRLWPLWIDAELNRNVVGRRERDWKQTDQTRFSRSPSRIVDAPGDDWAIALDEPFWFQVLDVMTGENYFTKAGDFELLDATGAISLLREGRRYALAVEEGRGVPSGRATRVKILKDGRIQGTDASGKIITDVNLGQIPLFMFQNPARLDSKDGVLFTPTPYSGVPQRASLLPGTTVGATQRRLALSNGNPEEILKRVVVLCKSKARLLELFTGRDASAKGIDAENDVPVDSISNVPTRLEPAFPAREDSTELEIVPTPTRVEETSDGVSNVPTEDEAGDLEGSQNAEDAPPELVLPEE